MKTPQYNHRTLFDKNACYLARLFHFLGRAFVMLFINEVSAMFEVGNIFEQFQTRFKMDVTLRVYAYKNLTKSLNKGD